MHRKRRFETKIFTENSSLCAGTSALCWIESSSGASPRCSGFLFGFPMVPWAWNMWPIAIWTTSLLTFVSRMIRMPSWTGSSCNWVLVTTLYLPCQSIPGYIYIYIYMYIYILGRSPVIYQLYWCEKPVSTEDTVWQKAQNADSEIRCGMVSFLKCEMYPTRYHFNRRIEWIRYWYKLLDLRSISSAILAQYMKSDPIQSNTPTQGFLSGDSYENPPISTDFHQLNSFNPWDSYISTSGNSVAWFQMEMDDHSRCACVYTRSCVFVDIYNMQ